MVGQIYPADFQVNKVNSFDTEVLFFDVIKLVDNKWHRFLNL